MDWLEASFLALADPDQSSSGSEAVSVLEVCEMPRGVQVGVRSDLQELVQPRPKLVLGGERGVSSRVRREVFLVMAEKNPLSAGDRFGRLVVIATAPRSLSGGRRYPAYRVQCDYGCPEKVMLKQGIARAGQRSCKECARIKRRQQKPLDTCRRKKCVEPTVKKDLCATHYRGDRNPLKDGERFGRLVVIATAPYLLSAGQYYSTYRVKCDCGCPEKVMLKQSIAKEGQRPSRECVEFKVQKQRLSGICRRKKCGQPVAGKGLCARHYRYERMRDGAHQTKQYKPSDAELDELLPPNMKCRCCERTMNWFRKGGGSTTVTLQHDRSGKVKLICFGCNVRHSTLPGDTYYKLPKGHWRCRICKNVKPLSEFPKRRDTVMGVNGACLPCNREQSRVWRRDNLELAKECERKSKRRMRVKLYKALKLLEVEGFLDSRTPDSVTTEEVKREAREAIKFYEKAHGVSVELHTA